MVSLWLLYCPLITRIFTEFILPFSVLFCVFCG
jgi:hypothetical protein